MLPSGRSRIFRQCSRKLLDMAKALGCRGAGIGAEALQKPGPGFRRASFSAPGTVPFKIAASTATITVGGVDAFTEAVVAFVLPTVIPLVFLLVAWGLLDDEKTTKSRTNSPFPDDPRDRLPRERAANATSETTKKDKTNNCLHLAGTHCRTRAEIRCFPSPRTLVNGGTSALQSGGYRRIMAPICQGCLASSPSSST